MKVALLALILQDYHSGTEVAKGGVVGYTEF